MENAIKKLQGLAKEKEKNFPGFIQSIQFPFYKNLEPGTRIDFNFPLTVFVGPNGCGKSSALQAVSCCPTWRSIESFWYETEVDQIVRSYNSIPNCYFYEYFNDEAQQVVQILKSRIKRENNPEYWEPSRPIEKYGMKRMPDWEPDKEQPGRIKTRWKVLEKNTVYLDFRSILSAYDKYFYFHDEPKTKRWKKKQDLIRDKSKALKRIFAEDNTYTSYSKSRRTVDLITEETLSVISDILGKKYASGKTLNHRLFHTWGDSTLFTTHYNNYSEAFAGSGETSVVKLVVELMNAPESSLILLDEPEVSLHPGALKKLQLFLLNQVIKKRHQIVICTHSPTVISDLPNDAIKVFTETPNGTFRIRNSALPAVAFEYIGNPTTNKKTIFVEDDSAKQLLDKIIERCLESQEANLLDVRFANGGAKDLYKDILVYSRNAHANRFFFLDGDQKPNQTIDVDNVSDTKLDATVKEATGIEAKQFDWHGDSGKPEQIIAEKRTFLKYIASNVKYLPAKDPEDIIWETSSCEQKSLVTDNNDYKERIRSLAEKVFQRDDAKHIEAARSMLLVNMNAEHDFSKAVKQELHSILESQ